MTLETIEPTAEWLDKHVGRVEKPARDQKTNRVTFRKLSPFETLRRNEDIDHEQFMAAQKLTRHWLGSQGVNVCDDGPRGDGDPPEFARTYHTQKFAEARKHVEISSQWDALMTCLHETGTAEDVGRTWKRVSCRKQARAYGVSLISFGLESLARLWGMRDTRTFHSIQSARDRG
jgi:hypothetical protein